MITVVIVAMTPLPVVVLVRPVAFIEIDVTPMSVRFPLVVIDDLTVVPIMIIVIFRVVDADASGASGHQKQAEKGN